MKKIKNIIGNKNTWSVLNKGEAGNMFVMAFLLLIFVLGFSFIGGQLPRPKADNTGPQVIIVTQPPEQSKQNLQLYTFMGITPTPPPPPPPVVAEYGCSQSQFNTEDEILVGSDPGPGATTSGKLRVWVTDELSPRIAPNEVIDPNSGLATTPGDRTALDSDSDGEGKFLWEPVVYVTPASGQLPAGPFCDATNTGCTPHFPDLFKGDYNSSNSMGGFNSIYSGGNPGSSTKGPPIDPDWINYKNGPGMANNPAGFRFGQELPFMSEYLWDVTKFGLAPGNYWAQFVIHDGDTNVGISCITLRIPESGMVSMPIPTAGPSPTPRNASLNPLGTPGGSNPECGIANPELRLGKNPEGKCCVMDGPVNSATDCCPGVPTCKEILDAGGSLTKEGVNYSCSMQPTQAALWCDAKPVIYLYPEVKTIVDVSLKVPGTIPVSIPFYPADGGWKNIEAYPGGKFIYQGKTYNELFYEANITPIAPPDNGIIVKRENINDSLKQITAKLGLNTTEQHEFLNYWMPRLNDLNSRYVHISVFSPDQKDIIDHVDITPKPDTFIQFIMYYKPLQKTLNLKPLQLPNTPPKRVGFTAVEWGGIIDK